MKLPSPIVESYSIKNILIKNYNNDYRMFLHQKSCM